MKKENERVDTAQQTTNNPGAERIAQNLNPRANENIRDRADKLGQESADMEDEVGTEITDGEDAWWHLITYTIPCYERTTKPQSINRQQR